MVGFLFESLALGAISCATVLLLTPPIITKLKSKGIVGVDLHKAHTPEVPSAGGLAILIGYSASFTFAGFLNVDNKTMLLVYLVGVLACLLGLIDDILSLNKKTLIVASLIIGSPFLTYHEGSTFITLTPFGPQDLGLLFWPIALIGVAFLSNSVNIYAGFNGLEAGLGLITSTSLGICASLYGSTESALILFTLAGSLLAFLKFNIYPAKIFIGNSGTYLIGAVIASAIIVGTIKTVGLIACAPFIINACLRLLGGLKWTVGNLTADGKVVCDKVTALWGVFMYKKPISEKALVLRCWLLQLVFGLLAVLYALLATYNGWFL
jgi:UDP-N-acetylglucosamine--dolichyl-phosphate N-acetylglucosaminephosphotransferase